MSSVNLMQSAGSPDGIFWSKAVFKSAIVATNNGALAVPVPLDISRVVTSKTCFGVCISSFGVDVSSALTKIGYTKNNKKSKANPLNIFRNLKKPPFYFIGQKSKPKADAIRLYSLLNRGTSYLVSPFICNCLICLCTYYSPYFFKCVYFCLLFLIKPPSILIIPLFNLE